jgi:hypothetical protein
MGQLTISQLVHALVPPHLPRSAIPMVGRDVRKVERSGMGAGEGGGKDRSDGTEGRGEDCGGAEDGLGVVLGIFRPISGD